MSKDISIKISDFIMSEWAEYADYDNRRSLPHIMDGLKITQRKAMYTATTLPRSDKPRVSQISSRATEITAYHHGESSMIGTVINLAQDYPGSNNLPWLEKHGQFGSRLSNDASAPRYIHTRLHANWSTMFKKEDQAIVEHLYDDGDQIEPKYFIPIIPTLLVNGSSGVGNGFKSKILTYNYLDVAKACKEILKTGKIKTPLIPYINGWHGKIEKQDNQITFTGVMKIVHTTKIEITEIPPKYDNEKYKKVLNKLLDDKIIKDYKNASTEDKWHWTIDCPRELTANGITPALLNMFGLVEKTTENFVCWGMDAIAPITFNSPEELVEYWYAARIPLYQKSIDYQIETVRQEIIQADLKMKFIKWCLKNDFRKLSKKEFITKAVEAVKNLSEDMATGFVGMPMYRITTDEVEKLMDEIDALLETLEALEQLTPEIMMDKNLKELK